MDIQSNRALTRRARLEQSINRLLGVLEGISIDGEINQAELGYLGIWLEDHADVQNLHPYNELVPVVLDAIHDGVLTLDERENIKWLCTQVHSPEYFKQVTFDLQRLGAVVAGIAADGLVTHEELVGLSAWLEEHEHLRRCWPYDEIDALVLSVLRDKKIDGEEHKLLQSFFSEFAGVLDDKTIVSPMMMVNGNLVGVCAVDPEIDFEGRRFCFTGESARFKRSKFKEIVVGLGGVFKDDMSASVDFLVIGSDGNPAWAYACYGRKVARAVELRKEGRPLMIVHENDFHDAVQDAGAA